MVNSGSFDSDVDRNEKDGFTQSDRVAESPQSVIPMHVVAGSLCENDFTTQTADSLPVSQAIEPTATKTEYKCNMSELFVGADEILTLQCNPQDSGVSLEYSKNSNQKTSIASERSLAGIRKSSLIGRDHELGKKPPTKNCVEVQNNDSSEVRTKPSVCCSVPLEKVQDVLKACNASIRSKQILANLQSFKPTKKDMCLYCDRTFITSSLKQKHVDRSHSLKHNRRLSARRQVAKQSLTACMFCEKLNNIECTLKQLFEHLVSEHPKKYFGCLECEVRFSSLQVFQTHNIKLHGGPKELPEEKDSAPIVLEDQKDSIAPDKSDKLPSNSRKTPKLVEGEEPKTEKLKAANKKTSKLRGPNFVKSDSTQGTIRVKIKKKCKLRYSNEKVKEDQDESAPSDSITSEPAKNASAAAPEEEAHLKGKSKAKWVKELRSKKVSVLSTKVGIKQCLRTTRQRTKVLENAKNTKRKLTSNKIDRNSGTSVTTTTTSSTTTATTKYLPYTHNPYPSFDFSFRVKKITDHSIDNIRISSMTFDDVFDKAFFNRVKCNIQENLLHYVDGKVFKSVESENRISSFQKAKDVQAEEPNQNCGSKISSNAITPVAAFLTSQFGEDLESQIEYGSKPSKKKAAPVVDDEVHYKYFTRRKYQAVISESREHRDLSKLDMWTQLAVKNRQQKISAQHKTDKEMLEYTKSDEYKVKMQVEELNKILDKRGPLEDLKEEAIRTVALEKLNGTIVENHIESYFDVTMILNELLNGLFSTESPSDGAREDIENNCFTLNNAEQGPETSSQSEEIPNMLNLRRVTHSPPERPVEDSPASEMDKTTMMELTGEWARTRIYVCAACGTKMPNAKSLIDHKNLYHEHVWCQHYEFVGNQGELYRHLSIPALGKIGEIEETSGNKMWRRSDSRLCSKCNKRFNCLGDLHRHILECGGDWSWMLARKKYKYRPYGSKARKKRRGLLRFLHTFRERKNDQTREKRNVIKKYTGPRQKPSDADTIQRMLANLPAKRVTRKVMSLKDGFQRNLKNQKMSKTNKNKSLRKQKLPTDKTAGKVLHKNQSGIKTSNKSRRLLRSNSTLMFENKVNMILPKFKKDRRGNNTSNLTMKRHSVRNIKKVLANQIIKAKTKVKQSEQEENVENTDVTDSFKNDVEDSSVKLDEEPSVNQTKSSKKSRITRFTKKLNHVRVRKTVKEKKSVLPQENTSKDKSVKSILPPQETITITVPEKTHLEDELYAATSPQSKKTNKRENLTMPVLEEIQEIKKSPKSKTRQKNSLPPDIEREASIDSSEPKLKVSNENQFPKLTVVLPQSKLKKKKQQRAKVLPALNGTDLTVQSKPQVVSVSEKIRTSCRRKSKVNKTISTASNVKTSTKKRKPARIKKKITKIVQVDGSSQSTPSTRSKSSKKEFSNPLFLCNSNDHTILLNTVTAIAENLSELPTIDIVTEKNPTSSTEADIFPVDLSEASPAIINNTVDDYTSPDKLEDTSSDSINKTNIIESSNILDLPEIKPLAALTLQDMTVQPISDLNKAPAMTAPNTSKKSAKKLRGLNDCIAMLTNKLQDKGSLESSFNDKHTPVFSTLKEVRSSPELFQCDAFSRKSGWKSSMTFQNQINTAPKASTERLYDSLEETNNVQNMSNNERMGNSTAIYDFNESLIDQFHETGVADKVLNHKEYLYELENESSNDNAISNIIPAALYDTSHNQEEVDDNMTFEERTDQHITVANDKSEDTPKTELLKDATPKVLEDSSVQNDTTTNLQALNIFKKVTTKTPTKKNKTVRNKTMFGQNYDVDNILQVPAEVYKELDKPKHKKPKTNQKQKKKKVNYLHNGKSLRNRQNQPGNCKKEFHQIEFINGAELFNNASRNTVEPNKNEEINDISKIKLMQNLIDNDQEGMLNTSDEFSNSGKENLIKVPKYRKIKNGKIKSAKKTKKPSTESVTFERAKSEAPLLKPSKLDIIRKPDIKNKKEESTVISDTGEFVDSEDDVPLALFVNKRNSCDGTNIESDLNTTATEEESREGKALEDEVLNNINSAIGQEEVDTKVIEEGVSELQAASEVKLHKSKKRGDLKMVVQLSKVERVNRKVPKININKIRRLKQFTKHRKRKNGDSIGTSHKKKEPLVLADNFVPENENEITALDVDKSVIQAEANNEEECRDIILERVTSTKEHPDLVTDEKNNVLKIFSADRSEDIFNNENCDEKSEESCLTQVEDKIENNSADKIVSELANCKEKNFVHSMLINEDEDHSIQVESLNLNSAKNDQILEAVATEDKLTASQIPQAKSKSKSKGSTRSRNVKVKGTSKSKDTNSSNAFCNICNKTFTRSENLLKHKRTLTHIAKLSELEALEAVEKAKEEAIMAENSNETSASQKTLEVGPKCDLSITDLLCNVDTMEHDYHRSTPMSTTFATTAQDSLKLVDIINDVLSKPMDDEYHNSFSNLILKSDLEVKRCKSLGERKSFDCDKLQLISSASSSPVGDINLDSNFVNTKAPSTADVIVEKQISLLENMIEDNRINFKPTDKMFISSELPITEDYSSQSNSSEFSILSSSKQEDCNEITFTHNTNIITNLIKPTLDEDNLLQSTQYEEISEDSSSSHFQFEEQKSRKVLNRDEELFLECCSLLKSSSDVSDLCKKSTKSTQFLNNFGLKPLDEMEWLEQKQLPQKNTDFNHASNIMLEDSHTDNSVSDNFCNDLSYSNSSASNCNLNLKVFLNRNENLFSQPPIFEDISAESEDSSEKSLTNCFNNFGSIATTMNGQNVNEGLKVDDRSSPSVESAQIPEEYKLSENIAEEKKTIILKLGRTINSKLDADLQNSSDMKIPALKAAPTQSSITDYAVSKKAKKGENKKMLTKGAMKVFEGLKVSIPKEGLDMKEVLSCSPTSKRLELEAEESVKADKKVCSEKDKVLNQIPVFNKIINNKKTALKKLGNKLGLKIKKKCAPSKKSVPKGKDGFMDGEKKSHDIYDFEETQDSIDVFPKNLNSLPSYHSFRNKFSDKTSELTKSPSGEKLSDYDNTDDLNSNCESGSYTNNVNQEEKSSSDSSAMLAPSAKKINVHKSITKKKCMIMGRIFKNAIKSNEVKIIPATENSQIVEDFVQSCQDTQPKDEGAAEHKLSEEEMNILFDNLLNEEKPKGVPNNKSKDKNGEVEPEASATTLATVKSSESKPKSKVNKCKKRQRANSPDSSDEEFSIKKIPKKPCNRKNSSNNECVINLEQELKECIGVASRKSQRKCTSGKQNVLVEYWSSDESNFEVEQNMPLEENPPAIEPALPESEATFSTPSQNYCNDNVITINEEQKDEPTVLPFKTNTYDSNSSNIKEKRKQIWSESPHKLDNPHKKKRSVFKVHKKAETTGEGDSQTIAVTRQKRTAVDTLYYWSSSSEDELQDVIEVKPIREEYGDEDRPLQQGWIVGDSPKKLVTMLAQAKGKKVDAECVKKNRKKRTSV